MDDNRHTDISAQPHIHFKHRTRTQLDIFISTLMVSGSVLALLFCLLIYGPVIESRFFPVFSDVVITEVNDNQHESVKLSFTGVKARGCRPLEALAFANVNGRIEAAEIRPVSFGASLNTPIGKQHLGVWEIKPKGTTISIEALHVCHNLWNTRTNVGTWEAKNVVSTDSSFFSASDDASNIRAPELQH